MSSAIMSLLISHILTFVESELVKEEPTIIATVTADVQLLIAKLEALLTSKVPTVATTVNPVLDKVAAAIPGVVADIGNVISKDA